MKNLIVTMTTGLLLVSGCNSYEKLATIESQYNPTVKLDVNFQEQIYFKYLSKFQDPFWFFGFDNRKIPKEIKLINNH